MKLITVDVEEELSSCSECGYAIGFHVSLQRVDGRTRVLLQCPHCGARFDTGWVIQPVRTGDEEQIT